MLLAEVVRSGFTESWHHGSYVILGADGAVVDFAGDPDGPIFPRSSNKPMQATGMVRAGLRLADPAHLALASASHAGEPIHVDRVRAMLDLGDLKESDLQCPPDLPSGEDARTAWLRSGRGRERIAMNCSGKHTAMLLTCRAADWPIENYRDPEHPLQRRLRDTVEELSGERVAAVGVDGCGAPVFALSLRALATAFLRVAGAEPGTAERSVADAIRSNPELIAGTGADRLDSRMMRELPGVLAKGGAEAVMGIAVPGAGAVAMKIDDGNRRPIGPLAATALRRLGLDAPVLDELVHNPLATVYGGGAPVGEVRMCAASR